MKKYASFILIVLLTACELTVHVDVPFERPQMTVNCIFDPDSLWNVSLSLNRHILDDSTFTVLNDASVGIYQEGNLVTTLTSTGNGNYRSSSSKPVAGVPYQIKVASNYGSIEGKSSSPLPPADLEVSFQERTTTNSQDGDLIELKFSDPAGEKNYYKITIESYQYYIDPNNQITKRSIPVYFRVVAESADESFNQDVYFPDRLFDGERHSLTLKTNGPVYRPSIRVSVWALSEDYYKYRETRTLQSRTSDNPFAQPVNVYNNISGGFGIFGGRTRSSVERKFADPVITKISPMSGKKGDRITIEFTGGSTTNRYNYQAYFTGSTRYIAAQPVGPLAVNSFQVVVPDNAITGKLVIFIDGVPIMTDQEFVVNH